MAMRITALTAEFMPGEAQEKQVDSLIESQFKKKTNILSIT
jgi:hypothetical protein